MADQVADKPIEITLGDGSKITGATLEDAFKNAAKRVEDNVTAYKTEKQKREQAEQETERLRGELQQAKNPPKVTDGKSFDREHYWTLMNTGHEIDAQDYLDRYRWDADPVQVRQQFQQLNQEVTELRQQAVVAQFLQQHVEDFPADRDAAKLLTERVQNLVTREGYPLNLRTMNAAYGELVEEKLVKPNKPDDRKADETPNPSLTGSGGNVSADSEIDRVNKMTDAELRDYLIKNGRLAG